MHNRTSRGEHARPCPPAWSVLQPDEQARSRRLLALHLSSGNPTSGFRVSWSSDDTLALATSVMSRTLSLAGSIPLLCLFSPVLTSLTVPSV